jgi:hypothetical protein
MRLVLKRVLCVGRAFEVPLNCSEFFSSMTSVLLRSGLPFFDQVGQLRRGAMPFLS